MYLLCTTRHEPHQYINNINITYPAKYPLKKMSVVDSPEHENKTHKQLFLCVWIHPANKQLDKRTLAKKKKTQKTTPSFLTRGNKPLNAGEKKNPTQHRNFKHQLKGLLFSNVYDAPLRSFRPRPSFPPSLDAWCRAKRLALLSSPVGTFFFFLNDWKERGTCQDEAMQTTLAVCDLSEVRHSDSGRSNPRKAAS